jgi:glycosyltransferase involved in cell wall biosynthesis
MVLGSLDTFLEAGASQLKLGRLSANAGLLRALLEYGTFQELRIFCPTNVERETLASLLSQNFAPELARRVKLCLQMELPEALRAGQIDLFHSAGWSRYLSGLARLRSRCAPHPMPITGMIHSLNGPEMSSRVRQFLSAQFLSCDAVFCSSTAGRDAFSRQLSLCGGGYNGNLFTLALGVHEECFHVPERKVSRAMFGFPSDAFVFLWFGRLSASSKADLGPLLYAFRRVRELCPNARLILAGGSDPGSVLAYDAMIGELGLKDSAKLMVNPSDEQRANLYGACDAFVSPVDNHQETFGLAVVEAMAAGLPVVVSDWDGYKDLVEEGVTGFRIPTFWNQPPREHVWLREILEPDLAQLVLSQSVAVDVVSLSGRMVELASHPEMSREMGYRAGQRARARFHWKVVIAQLEIYWSQLLHNAKGCDNQLGHDWNWDPWDAFGHYSTTSLQMGHRLNLSDDGRAVLTGKLPMPATWTDLAPISDGRLMTWIVRRLEREGEQTFGALRSNACQEFHRNPEDVTWMTLWLLKYGIIELSD